MIASSPMSAWPRCSAARRHRCANESNKKHGGITLMNIALKGAQRSSPTPDAMAVALLLPSGIDGVYARTAVFEDVVKGLHAFISRERAPGTEVLRFPPVMSRRQLEKSG